MYRSQKTNVLTRMLLVIAFVSAAAANAAEPVQTSEEISPQPSTESAASLANDVANTLPARLQELLMRAISLIGVKYKFGGSSAEAGFDCSGFVRHVFAGSLAVELPRSSYAMGRLGTKVDEHNLSPGDLVFYNTLHRAYSHVGIYLGEGRFVHAPSRGKSVEIVDMTERYWQRRFNGARRLILED